MKFVNTVICFIPHRIFQKGAKPGSNRARLIDISQKNTANGKITTATLLIVA